MESAVAEHACAVEVLCDNQYVVDHAIKQTKVEHACLIVVLLIVFTINGTVGLFVQINVDEVSHFKFAFFFFCFLKNVFSNTTFNTKNQELFSLSLCLLL